MPPSLGAEGSGAGQVGDGNFFVPADGAPPPPTEPAQVEEDEDEEEAPTLLQLLTEHLSLAFLSRNRAGPGKSTTEHGPNSTDHSANTDLSEQRPNIGMGIGMGMSMSSRDQREWDRVIVASLALLSQWLWEEPKAVREFLEGGGLSLVGLLPFCLVDVFPSSLFGCVVRDEKRLIFSLFIWVGGDCGGALVHIARRAAEPATIGSGRRHSWALCFLAWDLL